MQHTRFLPRSISSQASFLRTSVPSRIRYTPQVLKPSFARIPAPPISAQRTMATVQEYRLKLDNVDLKNGEKVEAEVEGVGGGKVILLKVNDQLRALGPKCTRTTQ